MPLTTASFTPTGSGSAGEIPHPPAGRWCAAPRTTNAMRFVGSPEVEGCAKFINGEEIPAGQDRTPEYIGMPRSTIGFHDPILSKMQRTAQGNVPICCYNWREKAPGGRPLVLGGVAWFVRPLLATLHEPSEASPLAALELPPESERPRLARHFLEQAALEHASVASFLRARRLLAWHGAPRELLERYRAASLEEQAHADSCLGIARRYGAPALGFPELELPAPAPTTLQELAYATLTEGLEPEASAALALHRVGMAARCPALARVLLQIAQDELGHARLALDTLGWCRRRGVDIASLASAARRAQEQSAPPPQKAVSLPKPSPLGELHEADWPALRAWCWEHALTPALKQLS